MRYVEELKYTALILGDAEDYKLLDTLAKKYEKLLVAGIKIKNGMRPTKEWSILYKHLLDFLDEVEVIIPDYMVQIAAKKITHLYNKGKRIICDTTLPFSFSPKNKVPIPIGEFINIENTLCIKRLPKLEHLELQWETRDKKKPKVLEGLNAWLEKSREGFWYLAFYETKEYS